jgi:uncharacterized protein
MSALVGIVIGVFSGMVTGFSGSSGVIVIIPLVTLMIGLPIHQAIGTSLLADVITSIPIAISYYRHKNVDLPKVAYLLMGALVGTQLGANEVGNIPAEFLSTVSVISLVAMGAMMIYKGLPRTRMEQMKMFTKKLPPFLSYPATLVIIGFLLGLLTGFFGASGGLFVFVILYLVFRMHLLDAIGTSTVFMLFAALAGTFGHVGNGTIDTSLGFLIGTGGVAGGVLASYIAHHISETKLARVIGGLFLFLGVAMFFLRVFVAV